MPYRDVQARLRTALTTVILDEYSLLETVQVPITASERVIGHQLAWRLRSEYSRAWDVDMEYNPLGHAAEPGGAGEPVDISIHHRGMRGHEHNRTVIRFRTRLHDEFERELADLQAVKDRYDYEHACLLDLRLNMGSKPDDPPVLVAPQWVWLPGQEKMEDIFTRQAARQLAVDGWEARQRRYRGFDDQDIVYDGWRQRTPEEQAAAQG
ncbi:MAG: hypothetical protein LBM66_06300 [Bifidobacteriaceae bacterium]|nr:hypothetical protein [Bifidobacteriaceae bacterium]